jgi:hypothetical protein
LCNFVQLCGQARRTLQCPCWERASQHHHLTSGCRWRARIGPGTPSVPAAGVRVRGKRLNEFSELQGTRAKMPRSLMP